VFMFVVAPVVVLVLVALVLVFVAIMPVAGAMAEAIEHAMRQRAERFRHARKVFGPVDEFFAPIQLAVERRQRMGMLACPILAPSFQHPFPGIGQTLQLQRADGPSLSISAASSMKRIELTTSRLSAVAASGSFDDHSLMLATASR